MATTAAEIAHWRATGECKHCSRECRDELHLYYHLGRYHRPGRAVAQTVRIVGYAYYVNGAWTNCGKLGYDMAKQAGFPTATIKQRSAA